MPDNERLLSLDFFRGITIAAMILVNNPGDWSNVYPPLLHADWHGWTFTDLIFPFFLFIVGVSIALAFSAKLETHTSGKALHRRIIRRSLLLFGLGLFLSGFPFYDLDSIRIPGVLQRIAICYLVASLVFIHASTKVQALWALALMLVYWACMEWLPVPGIGSGSYAKGENFSAWLDNLLLHGHMWSQTGTWDPEGVFSTLPAISTTLMGVLTGQFLRKDIPALKKTGILLGAGCIAIVIGTAWNLYLPINKNLWTSSYAMFMSGMAMVSLAISYYVIDARGWQKWSLPFRVYGMNAITVFVLAGIAGRLLYIIKWPAGSGFITLKEWLFNTFFQPWLSPLNASLAYALCFVFISYLAMYYLYKKQIFIKV